MRSESRAGINAWAKTQMTEYPCIGDHELRQSCKNKPLPRFVCVPHYAEETESENEYADRIELADDIKIE